MDNHFLSATQGGSTTESYTFDPVGNRTASLGVSSYTTNSANELTATPSTTYTYDSNGNTVTKVVSSNTTTYAWDFENRLSSVSLPGSGGTVSFKYDPFGRRIEKSSSAATSVFAYDGINLVEETNASGGVVARYSQGLNVDEPLAMLRSGATNFYNADGLGSVTSLSNAAGSLAQTYGYDSFGKQTSSSGSLTNPFQYTAREFDSETSLYYNRARYLDPTVGRFVSEDPLRFFAGPNFYTYVSSNPVNLNDPFGLCPQFKKCRGMARVLAGNPNTIGNPGGWSGPSVGNTNVAAGTAAVFTSQWGGKGNLRPFIGQVSATSNGQPLFNGISDIIGGKSPIPGMSAGNALMTLYPGDLLIELPSGSDLGVVPIELTIPATMNCPAGTTEVQ